MEENRCEKAAIEHGNCEAGEDIPFVRQGTGWKEQEVANAKRAAVNQKMAIRLDALPGYEPLAGVLQEALDQAQRGKGAQRHANGQPFAEQLICVVTRTVGLGFPLGQALKKAVEAKRLGGEHGRQELLGAINYLSAAVICSREGIE
ncbi:MAG: hypothetical protein ACOY4W_03685 [Thermodesulfobacteriota bacterium]